MWQLGNVEGGGNMCEASVLNMIPVLVNQLQITAGISCMCRKLLGLGRLEFKFLFSSETYIVSLGQSHLSHSHRNFVRPKWRTDNVCV